MFLFRQTHAALAAMAVLLVGLAALPAASAAKKKKKKTYNKPYATRENWDELVPDDKLCMTYFHIRGCAHCESFRKHWDRAQEHYQDREDIVWIEVQADEEDGLWLSDDFGVTFFPSIHWGNAAVQHTIDVDLVADHDNNKTQMLLDTVEQKLLQPFCSALTPEHCGDRESDYRRITAATDELFEEVLGLGGLDKKTVSDAIRQSMSHYGLQAYLNPFWKDDSLMADHQSGTMHPADYAGLTDGYHQPKPVDHSPERLAVQTKVFAMMKAGEL